MLKKAEAFFAENTGRVSIDSQVPKPEAHVMDDVPPPIEIHRIRAKFVGARKEGWAQDGFEFLVAASATDATDMRQLFQAMADLYGPEGGVRLKFDLVPANAV